MSRRNNIEVAWNSHTVGGGGLGGGSLILVLRKKYEHGAHLRWCTRTVIYNHHETEFGFSWGERFKSFVSANVHAALEAALSPGSRRGAARFRVDRIGRGRYVMGRYLRRLEGHVGPFPDRARYRFFLLGRKPPPVVGVEGSIAHTFLSRGQRSRTSATEEVDPEAIASSCRGNASGKRFYEGGQQQQQYAVYRRV